MFKKMFLIFIPVLIAPGCTSDIHSELRVELFARLQASGDSGLTTEQAVDVLNGDINDLVATSYDGMSLKDLLSSEFKTRGTIRISMSQWMRLQELCAKARFAKDFTKQELQDLQHLLSAYLRGLPLVEAEAEAKSSVKSQ